MTDRNRTIQRIKEFVSKKYPDAEVFLFGSQARGNAREISDWDLLVLFNSKNVSFPAETKVMDDFYELELEIGQVDFPSHFFEK